MTGHDLEIVATETEKHEAGAFEPNSHKTSRATYRIWLEGVL